MQKIVCHAIFDYLRLFNFTTREYEKTNYLSLLHLSFKLYERFGN